MIAHSSLTPAARANRVRLYKQLLAANPESPRVALWQSALSHMHFLKTVRATVKAAKLRSAAAKRGWAKRRGN